MHAPLGLLAVTFDRVVQTVIEVSLRLHAWIFAVLLRTLLGATLPDFLFFCFFGR